MMAFIGQVKSLSSIRAETRGTGVAMPAIITHDFFGRDIYNSLFSQIGGSRDEADAFLLGNQGPDPLFYAAISPQLGGQHKLGHIMHERKPSELLVAFKESLGVLDPDEVPVGRAYALGFLCHYTLDSTMHPFVYFHEYRLCDAGEPGLTRDDGGEVHGVIESELDELVLYKKREETIASFNPAREILRADASVLDAISKMYAYVALNVYGEIIPRATFATAVRDFRLVQHAFYSPTGLKRELAGAFERLFRTHSFYQSMSHRPIALTASVFDNRDHEPWENPFTGEVRTAGFWDLYDEAQGKARANIATFLASGFDEEAARGITHGLDFSGKPTHAVIVSIEDGEGAPSGVAHDAGAEGEKAEGAEE